MKTLTCPCGEPLQGDTDEEFVASVNDHFTAAHPQLSGKYTDEQILSGLRRRRPRIAPAAAGVRS